MSVNFQADDVAKQHHALTTALTIVRLSVLALFVAYLATAHAAVYYPRQPHLYPKGTCIPI
jgi:hypothetical protein